MQRDFSSSCNDTTGRLQSCWRVAKFHVDGLAGSNAVRGEGAVVPMVGTYDGGITLVGI